MNMLSENPTLKSYWLLKWIVFIALVLGAIALFTVVSSVEAASHNQKVNVREIGVGNVAAEGECTDNIPDRIRGNDYTPGFDFKFEGGLEGCIYTYVDTDTAGCSARADGTFTYYEEGNELFVGTYSDDGEVADGNGRIKTNYWFEATFPTMSDCENFTNQIDGGCVHKFISGTGTGVFKKARGQYGIVDNIVDGVAINFPYILDLKVRR